MSAMKELFTEGEAILGKQGLVVGGWHNELYLTELEGKIVSRSFPDDVTLYLWVTGRLLPSQKGWYSDGG